MFSLLAAFYFMLVPPGLNELFRSCFSVRHHFLQGTQHVWSLSPEPIYTMSFTPFLPLSPNPHGDYHLPHLKDEETEAQRCWVISLGFPPHVLSTRPSLLS